MRFRLLIASLLLAAVVGPAWAVGTPGGVPGVDGRPLCGVEGTGGPVSLPSGQLPRVGTYNILHAQHEQADESLEKRLPLIADAMAAADMDVWGLQEVTNNSRYGVAVQTLAQDLAERTGQRWEWCWAWSNPHVPGEPDAYDGGGGPLSDEMAQFSNFPESGDFREGEAFVTRLHVLDTRFRRLTPRSYETATCTDVPPDPLGCNFTAFFDSRMVLWARIDAGSDGGFDFVTTHMAHDLTPVSGTTRSVQTRAALAYVDQWTIPDSLPDFFVGDFNSQPTSDPYAAMMADGFEDTYHLAGGTECRSTPDDPTAGCTSDLDLRTPTADQSPDDLDERIDFVWARPGGCGLAVEDGWLVGTAPALQPDGMYLWPSDHFGVASITACTPSSLTP